MKKDNKAHMYDGGYNAVKTAVKLSKKARK